MKFLGTSAAVGLATAALTASQVSAEVYFKETFPDASWESEWIQSNWKGNDMGKWDLSPGEWFGDATRDAGLRTTEDFRFYTIGKAFEKVASNKDKDLVLQFSVKHEKRDYSFCGGGYIKLFPEGTDFKTMGGDSPYHIMFGPDLCGYDVSRIHAIFNHKGENLLKTEDIKLEYQDKNEFTHLYTLVVHPDKTYEVYFDLEEKASGSLWDHWKFPPKSIDDPEDKKPEDWVDTKQIPDPEDQKPEGYDDIPEQIPDPEAAKPDDWDDEDDGEWEAPMIPNPEYKGPWKPKMIDNPEYKGEWKPKQIDNPEYDPNIASFENIGGVGFELWVVNSGSVFDNIFVGDNLDEAKAFADETFAKTKEEEKAAKEKLDKEAEEKKKAEEEAEKEAEEEEEDEVEEAEDDASPHDEL